MGIPSYFSMLMRRHKAVLRAHKGETATNLCLDSNSIVYDMVRKMEPNKDPAAFEAALIAAVCKQIDGYIETVRPQRVFIAFDGVPPMAKMKQQRERRYKAAGRPSEGGWDTMQITPGTKFMVNLDAGLHAYFNAAYTSKFAFFKVSTSREPGEGEHKLFEWIRCEKPTGNTFVYGLDSDLIILALQHLHLSPGIALLRETPAFTRSNGLQLLNVTLLATQIELLLGAGKLADYIFLTFFLGNDFMPHFPALNLRTKGLDILLKTYKEQVGKNETLITGTEIHWKVVQKLIFGLAGRESADVAREYADRGVVAVDDVPENIPRLRREVEHYINPPTPYWEDRYYSILLKVEAANIKSVCVDFYRMLEWNAMYYVNGCSDWRLYYPHAYPPLLRDLSKHPYQSGNHGAPSTTEPHTEEELLKFIFPASAAHYASVPYTPVQQTPEVYWAFCTFDWESHLLF